MNKIRNFLPIEIAGMVIVDVLVSWLLKTYVGIPFLLAFLFIATGYIYSKLRNNEKTKVLAKISAWILGFVFILNAAFVLFPLTMGKVVYVNKDADLYMSQRLADSVKTKENHIYEAYKNITLDKKLIEYKKLLKEGKPEEAARLMAEIRDKWDLDKINQRIADEKKRVADSITQSKVRTQDAINPKSVSETLSQSINPAVGGEYGFGEYTLQLKKGQESDWVIVKPPHAYTFKGQNSRVSLLYEDGTIENSWNTIKWPNKYKFKVINQGDEMPTLKIM